MSAIRFEGNIGRELQELARHQIITRLYADILADMAVCEIEGWDKMEFIRQLKTTIDHFALQEEQT